MQKQTFNKIDKIEERIGRLEKYISGALLAILLAVLSNHFQYKHGMKLIRKYPYKHYNRFSDTTGRKYLVDNVKVPSVTTILSATKDTRF